MYTYEKPRADILEFLAREPLANIGLNEPALVDDGMSVEPMPTFKEEVEDW